MNYSNAFTIQYRGEPVHFATVNGEEVTTALGKKHAGQKAAHIYINGFLSATGKMFPCIVRDLLSEIKLCNDGDSWGTCCGWLFALGDYMTEQGETPPFDFSQSICGPNRDAWEFEFLDMMQPDNHELHDLAAILDRWYNILKAAGKDY